MTFTLLTYVDPPKIQFHHILNRNLQNYSNCRTAAFPLGDRSEQLVEEVPSEMFICGSLLLLVFIYCPAFFTKGTKSLYLA